MINHQYRPFLDEDIDLTEPEDVTAWRLSLEPHSSLIAMQYEDLIDKHALLHLTGHAEGSLHDLCMRAILQTEEYLARLKQSIHN